TTFFDEDGELKRHKYNNFLRSIFGNIDTREETVDSIKKRLSKIFEEADEMMEDGRKSLSISGEEMSQAVIIIKDYAELVKIACKANGQKERFEARRKIEFMWQIYKSKYNPRFVFSKRDAKLVRERLEGPKDGVKIDPSAPFKILCFTDNPDGIEIVGESEMGDRLSASQEDIAVHLISAKFAGTDCCILPMDETHEDVGNKYIGRKSLKSIVMKKIRKRIKMDAIHDLLRTTFVAKTREDLLKIQQYLEDNYFGFATTLKRENRYGEFVAVETIDVADNKSKSDEYKALRYVAEIPISSETKKEIYIVPVEIRILLEEDLAKERSNYHDASHKNYERRRDREFMERMLPVEIYPHLYEEKTDPKDIFRKKQYKLKTA
ncbi:hypothetical protein HZC20_01730, partial [Candidatus Peregrinibacteria bacterium]|nr:hypothetical protein [Candidatus Peregrinibacteria bacterium]